MRLLSDRKIEAIKFNASVDTIDRLIKEFNGRDVAPMTGAETAGYLFKVRQYLIEEKSKQTGE